MRYLARALLGLVLTAATLGVLAFAAGTVLEALELRRAERAAPRPAQERVFAAPVAELRAGTETPLLAAFGEVRAQRTLDLRSPRSGVIAELATEFRDGAPVRDGQVLVRLDPADAAATLALAENDHARAAAEAAEARHAVRLAQEDLAAAEAQAAVRIQALARQEALLARGSGSEAAREAAALAASGAEQAVLSRRQALAQAEARAEQAASLRARAAIALAEAERALADTVLRAEFDGLLTAVAAVEGGLVAAGERLAQIVDPARLEVAVRLSTAQFARLADPEGRLRQLPVLVRLEVPGAAIESPGRLTRTAATVGAGQTGRLVFADIATPGGFRPGDFVTVTIAEPPLPGVARLPAAAVDANQAVLLVGADDRLEAARVEVLRRQGDTVLIRVPPDLEGRVVVTERTPLLGPGLRIRPLDRDGRPPAGDGAALAPAGLVPLSPEHRARLVALVEGNARLPAEARARLLAQLTQDRVPAELIARIEARSGG